MSKKISTSMRLSEDAVELLRKLADKFGVSQAAIMEIAVRKLAEQEQVSTPK